MNLVSASSKGIVLGEEERDGSVGGVRLRRVAEKLVRRAVVFLSG
jgi:hypothetical protein